MCFLSQWVRYGQIVMLAAQCKEPKVARRKTMHDQRVDHVRVSTIGHHTDRKFDGVSVECTFVEKGNGTGTRC